MYLETAALVFPAGAAAALAVASGSAVLRGDGAVSFAVLAVTGALGLAAVVAAALRARRRREALIPLEVEALLGAVPAALAEAAVAFDASGRAAWANDAALALVPGGGEGLVAKGREAFGPDVAVLLRGLARGPVSGDVAIVTTLGRVTARAVAVRLRPSLIDVAVIRVEGAAASEEPRAVGDEDILPEPPPVPTPTRPSPSRALASNALLDEVGGPVAQASEAASLLRLALPPGSRHAQAQLGRIEHALARVEERLALLASGGNELATRAPLDLDALLSDALAGVRFSPGVRVRRAGAPAPAVGDAGQVRLALRHALRAAAADMPAGGELALRTSVAGGEAAVEIADTGAGDAGALELALADRIVCAQGGRLERRVIRGRGALCRLSLPASAGARHAQAR